MVVSGTSAKIVLGGNSDSFTASGTNWVADLGNGATLVTVSGGYVYTASDGMKINFRTIHPENQYGGGAVSALADSFIMPNGEKINITYSYYYQPLPPKNVYPERTIVRVQSITAGSGWQIKLAYATNASSGVSPLEWQRIVSAQAINNSVDYCAPGADACSGLTQSWPTLSFAKTATGITVTDPLGRASQFNGLGQITGIRRPSSPSADNISYTYDANGRVASVARDGVPYTYSFSLTGSVLTGTLNGPNGANGAVGIIRVTTADTVKNVITQSKDYVTATTFVTTNYQYDANGRQVYFVPPEGSVSGTNPPTAGYTKYTYDARGNAIEERRVSKTPGTPADIVVSAGYSATCASSITCNQPIWTKDAKGNQTDFAYDATTGQLLSITSPAPIAGGIRPQTRYTYSALQAFYKNSGGSIVASGIPISVATGVSTCQTTASCAGTADEVKTTIAYGPQVAGTANNLLPISTTTGSGDGALAATTALTYDAVGNQIMADGPLPGTADTSRTRYDAARQAVGTVGPDPDGAGARLPLAQRNTYNLDGQVTQSELGTVTDQSDAAWTAFSSQQQSVTTYDSNARPVKQTGTAGGTTYAVSQTSYDTLGRVDCSVQRMDPAQWSSQPTACTPQTTGPNGPDRVTKTTYNAASEVTQVQSGFGTTEQANEVSTTYNLNGTTATVTDGENNRTTHEYDGHDRLLKTRYPMPTLGALASSATDYEQLTYDANGNVTQRRLRDAQLINYSYDALNRVTLKDVPNVAYYDYDKSYIYDLLGRTISVSDASGTLSYGYDALGRQTSETVGSWAPWGTIASQYDAAGRRTRLTHPDGFFVTYDYDATGSVTAIRENGAASGLGVLGTYAYDDLGRRTSLTRGNGTVTNYEFGAVSRLVGMKHDVAGTTSDWLLGKIGATGTPITYNPGNQILSATRDNDGYAWNKHYNINRPYTVSGLNQLTTAGTTALSYDGRGNLTGSGTATYGYTSENLLTTSGGTALGYDGVGRLLFVQGSNFNVFRYDGTDLVAEYSATNQLTRRYVHGPGIDEPLVWYEGVGTTDRRFLYADERGSVIAVSNASGTVTNINAYDEYGIPAASNVGRFGYTGQTWLPEVGLNYYKARMYSPTLGRFMQSDPIGYGDGINFYAYVGNDPVNATDPDGQFKLFKFLGKVVKRVALNFVFRAVGNVIGVGSSAGRVSSLAPDTRPKPSRGPLSTPNPFDRPLPWVLNADSDTAGDIVVNGRAWTELEDLVETLNRFQCVTDVANSVIRNNFSVDSAANNVTGIVAGGVAAAEANASRFRARGFKPINQGNAFRRGAFSRGSAYGLIGSAAYNTFYLGIYKGFKSSSSCKRI
jgi:RHS repeat-associated protein